MTYDWCLRSKPLFINLLIMTHNDFDMLMSQRLGEVF